MLFNSPPFPVFFICFFLLYHLVLEKDSHRLWLVLIGSLGFYACWNYKYVPLLLGTGIIDFLIARAIDKQTVRRRRKLLLFLSVGMNLAVLGFFKYTNFVLDTGASLLGLVGHPIARHTLDIIVPVGVSFYTFQSISYTVDIYRKVYQPRKSVLGFLASLTFFPHLVAGPIVRSSFLIPQFESLPLLRWESVRRGFLLVAFGLAKKTIADLLAPLSQALFDVGTVHSVLQSWTGMLAFTGQLYGDFSGYTDMAIGLAALLGFTLPGNFNLPFLATSPVDYWNRWHISLSTWFRDYLFFPLQLRYRTHRYAPLIATMVMVGMWHGANWNFFCFGLVQGLLLAATNFISPRLPESLQEGDERPLVRVAKIAVTFYFMSLSLALFRAKSIGVAFAVWRDLHRSSVPSVLTRESVWMLGLVVAAIVFCHYVDYLIKSLDGTGKWPVIAWVACALFFAFGIVVGPAGQSFVYFQF